MARTLVPINHEKRCGRLALLRQWSPQTLCMLAYLRDLARQVSHVNDDLHRGRTRGALRRIEPLIRIRVSDNRRTLLNERAIVIDDHDTHGLHLDIVNGRNRNPFVDLTLPMARRIREAKSRSLR
jgi:hypothetical protein